MFCQSFIINYNKKELFILNYNSRNTRSIFIQVVQRINFLNIHLYLIDIIREFFKGFNNYCIAKYNLKITNNKTILYLKANNTPLIIPNN